MGKVKDKPNRIFKNNRRSARAQFTMVEHALSPLEPPEGPFDYEAKYYYFGNRKRKLGKATIHFENGWKPEDEFYLYGILGLVFSQPELDVNFYASPTYILRELGCGDGGKMYGILRDTLSRLSAVRYENDNFYDAERGEYRSLRFHFLSHDIPAKHDSTRPWRIVIDPLFFDLCKYSGSFLAFDRAMFRKFSPAGRRLFLLLSKLFRNNKDVTHFFNVKDICVHQLGYQDGQRAAEFNKKIFSRVQELGKEGVVCVPSGGRTELCEKVGKGNYRVRFHKSPDFGKERETGSENKESDSLIEAMKSIPGLNPAVVPSVIRENPRERIFQWVDATLMAVENKGAGYFSKGPAQFFMDGINRRGLPPDWYFESKRERERAEMSATGVALRKLGIGVGEQKANGVDEKEAFQRWLKGDKERLRETCEAFGGDVNAAIDYLRGQFRRESSAADLKVVGSLFRRVDEE